MAKVSGETAGLFCIFQEAPIGLTWMAPEVLEVGRPLLSSPTSSAHAHNIDMVTLLWSHFTLYYVHAAAES